MKFGKQLRSRVDESYEEWRPMFMNYKTLKKCIHPSPSIHNRIITQSDTHSSHTDSQVQHNTAVTHDVTAHTATAAVKEAHHQTKAASPLPPQPQITASQATAHEDAVRSAEVHHARFFALFRSELDKVNDFFLDKQEDNVIQHAQLSSKVVAILTPGHVTRPNLLRLKQRLIAFHGELVLLEGFSTVNYTGFRKILKKFDKKTGLNMRHVYLNTVLYTPFFLSDTVRKIILKTETQLTQLANVRKFRRVACAPSNCAPSTPHIPVHPVDCTAPVPVRPAQSPSVQLQHASPPSSAPSCGSVVATASCSTP